MLLRLFGSVGTLLETSLGAQDGNLLSPFLFIRLPLEERLEVGDEGVAKVYRIIALPGGHSPKQRLSQCPGRNLSSSSMGTKGGFRFLSWGDLL